VGKFAASIKRPKLNVAYALVMKSSGTQAMTER